MSIAFLQENELLKQGSFIQEALLTFINLKAFMTSLQQSIFSAANEKCNFKLFLIKNLVISTPFVSEWKFYFKVEQKAAIFHFQSWFMKMKSY